MKAGQGGFTEWTLNAAGIRQAHHTLRSDGTYADHEGGIADCRAPECQWPQLGVMATVEGRTEHTGAVREKTAGGVTVETFCGDRYTQPVGRVRRPDWGVYCPHGVKLVEAVPAAHTCEPVRPLCTKGQDDPFHMCPEPEPCQGCYPEGRKILPWPCERDECSEAAYDRAEQEEGELFYEEMCRSCYG